MKSSCFSIIASSLVVGNRFAIATSGDNPGLRRVMACPNKQVQIYKFWINGDCDVGAYGEHALRLDGKKYFPNSSHDCPMDPYGYCEWREGQAHYIGGTSRWMPIDGYKSLTVGTEEHDGSSENDSITGEVAPSKWNFDTCEHYEIRIARDFKEETARKVCWTAGASLSGEKADVSGGMESCSEWTQPAESFIWYLKIKPV